VVGGTVAAMSAIKRARIEVRLRDLAQLFNSMDPSPFLDRDLDADAEEFIVSWAREHPADHELDLVIHLATTLPADGAAGVEEAVRHYFGVRAQMKAREFRQLMRHGRISLAIGLLFLASCLFLGGLVTQLRLGTTVGIIREGLTIVGWVAMWRPLQIFLYDWWPIQRKIRLYLRLATAHIQVVQGK
jgi:hypothetical protein